MNWSLLLKRKVKISLLDAQHLYLIFNDSYFAKDLEVVLDLVPNHSSDKHEWFIASEKRVDPYTDYYVWQDGREGNKLPPNNWVSRSETN